MDYLVRVDDINYGGHLGNERLLLIAQQARIEFFQSLGYSGELGFGNQVGIIMADAAIEFKAEAFLGDRLTVELAISGPSKYGFSMYYRVTKAQKTVALIKTGILFMNYAERKLCSIPSEFAEKVNIT